MLVQILTSEKLSVSTSTFAQPTSKQSSHYLVALFTDNIEHSAQPFCDNNSGSGAGNIRYSFAVKVARTRRLATIKRIYEVAEELHDTEVHEEHERSVAVEVGI